MLLSTCLSQKFFLCFIPISHMGKYESTLFIGRTERGQLQKQSENRNDDLYTEL